MLSWESDANVCHVTTLGFFARKVSDDACLKCHDAPAHHADKVTFTAQLRILSRRTQRFAAASKHEPIQAAPSAMRNCAPAAGSTQYVRAVKDFDKQHPEFAVLRLGATDPGQIKLNHYAHLRPNLAGPDGPVQMDCQDCHRLAWRMDADAWPYAMSQRASSATCQPGPVAPYDIRRNTRAPGLHVANSLCQSVRWLPR